MARDAELDRLEAAQEHARQRKQDTFRAQRDAWHKRMDARETMHRAYVAKQRASAQQDRTERSLANVRAANGPRIASLRAQQATECEKMDRAREAASDAYHQRDAASAARHAEEARHYQEEFLVCVAERRKLIGEIRVAKEAHEAATSAFEQAKAEFITTKRSYEAATTEQARLLAEFKDATAEYNEAAKAFETRLERVRAAG